MEGDTLDQPRDLLGRGSALRGRGIHGRGFILPWRAVSGGRYREPVLRLSGTFDGVSLGRAVSEVTTTFWVKLAGYRVAGWTASMLRTILKALRSFWNALTESGPRAPENDFFLP